MLSRKQFLEEMLSRGFRTLNILTGGDRDCITEHKNPGQEFDLPLTELSPSLLAIEAEQRGIHIKPGCADELRRVIYQEMSLKGQNATACKP
jgi:hypothetical protein